MPDMRDLSGASAGGDNIAGDKVSSVTHNHYASPAQAGKISQLLSELATEIKADQRAADRLETLLLYEKQIAHDGVIGLEAKLTRASRTGEISRALDRKLLFNKILTRFAFFPAAQAIFAHLLSAMEDDFRCLIEPQLDSINSEALDIAIRDDLITPAVDQVGGGILEFNRAVAHGMFYWLAEQCYVRWHQ